MKRKNLFSETAVLAAALAMLIAVIPFGVKAANVTSVSDNCAPIAENLEFKTYKSIAVNAPLRAIDPDGDLLCFSLTSDARKGKVELSQNGSFTYTPAAGEKGSDSFTYVAADSKGAISREARVGIEIKSPSCGVRYADMDNSSSAFAALRLAEEGIFIGRKVGDSYFFDPETNVKRGEFLAMCMGVAGVKSLDSITRTGFNDDAEIAEWAKPYISSALLAGVIKGYSDGNGTVVFLPEKDITFSEAAVMLSGALEISDVKSNCDVPKDAVAVWAYQSVANLEACNIINSGSNYCGELMLTRADAADMLSAAMDIMEKREKESGNFSLFGWVFG